MSLVLFALAALVALVLGPWVRRFAIRLKAQDRPGHARKVHQHETPRLGGLAIAAATFSGVIAAILLGSEGGLRILEFPAPVVGLALAGAVVAIVGLIDDVRSLSAGWQFLGQATAATIVWWFGFRIEVLDLGALSIATGWLSLPLSLLWFIAVMNALNFIDGLDGLAASQTLIALVVLLTQAMLDGGPVAGVVAVALAGGVAGFLVLNVRPSRQFMGTCGSQLLGLVLACLAVGTLRGRSGMNPIVPLLAFAVPLLDLGLAFVRRLAQGRSPFAGDREHLHHRLLDRGFMARQAVWRLALWQSLFGALAIAAMVLPGVWIWAPIPVAAFVAIGIAYFLGYFGPRFGHREADVTVPSIRGTTP